MKILVVLVSALLASFAVAKRGGGGGGAGEPQLLFKGRRFEAVTYAEQRRNFYLECEVGGRPSPTIHWLKNGERIQQGQSHDYLNDAASFEEKATPSDQPMLRLGKVKSRLYLDCVTKNDEAEYTCVAETPTERISQSTVLKIEKGLQQEVSESCIVKRAFRGEPARIHLWTALRLEYEGASVQLYCRADGFPAPKCSWRYLDNGAPIVDDANHEILPNGDLLIKDISWLENMGDYYCRCENSAGIDEISTFLYPTVP